MRGFLVALCAAFLGGAPLDVAAQEVVGTNPPMSLQEARVQLSEASRDLTIARHRVSQAQLLEDQARSVLMPSFNIQFSYTFRDSEVEFGFPNVYAPLAPYLDVVYNASPELQAFLEDNPEIPDARALAAIPPSSDVVVQRHDYQTHFTVFQTVFDMRALALLDQAETTLEQAEAGEAVARSQLDGALVGLYFEALRARRFVEVAIGNSEIARIEFDRAQTAFDENVGNRFEVSRAEITHERILNDQRNAELAYTLTIEALMAMLDVDQPFDVVVPPEVDAPSSLDALVEAAVQWRPEVGAADLAIRLDEERLSENRASWWPTVRAQAQATVVRESTFSGDAFSWSLGLFLNWDVWDGGLRLAQRDTIELDIMQDELRREQVADQISDELRATWRRYETQQALMPTIVRQVELGERNLWLAQEALNLGVAGSLDVDTAQQQLFLAQRTLADAEITLQSLTYELRRLAGDLPIDPQ